MLSVDLYAFYSLGNAYTGCSQGEPEECDSRRKCTRCCRPILPARSNDRDSDRTRHFVSNRRNYSVAESLLSRIQSILLEYELRLNPRKTRIIDLPESLEQKWSTELRSLPVRVSQSGQYFDFVRFFDRAFEFAKEYPEDTVLKYAVERISKIKLE